MDEFPYLNDSPTFTCTVRLSCMLNQKGDQQSKWFHLTRIILLKRNSGKSLCSNASSYGEAHQNYRY